MAKDLYLQLISCILVTKEAFILRISELMDCCFVNGAFSETEIYSDAIRDIIHCNGCCIIKCEQSMISKLNYNGTYYIKNKINTYLYIVYNLYKSVKNNYFQGLQTYIKCDEINAIIVRYVMSIYENEKMIEYIENINEKYISHGLYYLNDTHFAVWKKRIKQIKYDESFKFKLTVKNLSGRAVVLDNIDGNEKIATLRDKLEPLLGYWPPERIIWAGKLLEGNTCIAAHNMPNEATLHLVMQLR
eukprot:543799_1